jgi:hypothetical protein
MALKDMLAKGAVDVSERVRQLKPEASKQASMPASMQQEEGVWTVTLRLPVSLVRGLQEAALDRKKKKFKPSSQQDIVAMLLREWLENEGYLS